MARVPPYKGRRPVECFVTVFGKRNTFTRKRETALGINRFVGRSPSLALTFTRSNNVYIFTYIHTIYNYICIFTRNLIGTVFPDAVSLFASIRRIGRIKRIIYSTNGSSDRFRASGGTGRVTYVGIRHAASPK